MRDPLGQWIFYQDVSLDLACSRYFGKTASGVVHTKIEIEWIESRNFFVRVPQAGLNWQVSLQENMATCAFNRIAQWLPDSFWEKKSMMNAMGKVVSIVLKTGSLTLAGEMPNGQGFVSNPRLVWLISQSRAVLNGKDLGNVQPFQEQTRIGDYWIPQRGLFVIANATIESYDSLRHYPAKIQKNELNVSCNMR